MRLLYFATGLLWVVLAALLLVLVSVLTAPTLSISQRLVTTAFLVLFCVPVILQLRASHSQIRDMNTNRIVLDDAGVDLRLSGRAREWKGLPDVAERLGWPDIRGVSREWQRFVYPSVMPFGYKLEVFTLQHAGGEIAFTRECVPHAQVIAERIAAKVGGQV